MSLIQRLSVVYRKGRPCKQHLIACRGVLSYIYTAEYYSAVFFSSSRLFLYLFLVFDGYTSQFRVNHDTSAILANDDFLTRTDIQLSLGWDFVEATATSVTLYIYDTQSVAEFLRIRLKDWSKRGSILVSSSLALSLSFSSSCLVSEMISSSSFFLNVQVFLSFIQRFCALCGFSRFLLFLCSELFDSLITKFHFQSLEFDFFAQEVVLTVVAYILLLFLVFLR